MLMQTLDDAAVIALIPGLVHMLRRTGLPARLETAAMVAGGMLLVCLVDLAGGVTQLTATTVAGWILTGLIDGLAAAGLARAASLPTHASLPTRASTSGRTAVEDEGRRPPTLR